MLQVNCTRGLESQRLSLPLEFARTICSLSLSLRYSTIHGIARPVFWAPGVTLHSPIGLGELDCSNLSAVPPQTL